MTAEKKGPTHRTSVLRKFQNIIAPAIPGIIGFLDSKGYFPDTKIHQTMIEKRPLQADDITLSQLQMTDYICNIIGQKKPFPDFAIEYFLTSLLNGADGPVARRMKTESKEGGIKDAAVDRLSEVMVAKLITKEIGLSEDISHKLQVSFQLSTLTKAACEMANVKTSEGGMGSMIERRKILFFILKDLIQLNRIPESSYPKREKIMDKIKSKVNLLIESSKQRALERIDALELSAQLYGKQSLLNSLNDQDSSSSSEAIKYAGIVTLNKYMDIDIVGELNQLTAGEEAEFPGVEYLKEKHKYIRESLDNVQGFLDEALTIAGYKNNKATEI